MGDCFICERIAMIRDNKNPYFVAELETGFAVIGDHQFFKGYTLFICKHHVTELHFLDSATKRRFLLEMSWVAEAVYDCFKPVKLNYELLGNGDAHLHWHLFPRRSDEPNPKGPVWWTDKNLMYADNVRPSDHELEAMINELRPKLQKVIAANQNR
ncbi:hypothetical protein SD70_18250 [Gordoniibacillus kamchatkensis]|uniref:HIT domain-containing protein n=1 Tax=Gordoniibacillus kamchatkensis TaxID=1590651 RepID=A0ABR5AH62_9BACL|nr:HIT family protein [Paenibacillus sp. VKM B-2647]KIL39702.1 hypothetical protein SD70_18250 [Paenibacillus sp. VKM B-2647]